MNLSELSALTENQAREYFEAIIWPSGAVCPHCESKNVTRLKGKAHRKGLHKCNECKKQFTATVGTIFHRTHIGMRHWLMAIYLMCSSKKGISALQLSRDLGIGYKSAWFMCHRVRYAMTQEPYKGMLQGTVEIDETYVGGKPNYRKWARKNRKKIKSGKLTFEDYKPKRGRGTEKVAVLTLVERREDEEGTGIVHSMPVRKIDGRTLKGKIRYYVHPSARIITDEWPAYHGLGWSFRGGHDVILHRKRQYVRDDVYTNTAESYFALLKRGIHGIFHHISPKHLQRYLEEVNFKWGLQEMKDGLRLEIVISSSLGRRLSYHDLIS